VLLLDDDVAVRVVHAAGPGEQLLDPPLFRELGRPALIEGEILTPGVLPLLEAGVLERGRGLRVRHATGTAPDRAAAHLRPVDLYGGGRAGEGSARSPGRGRRLTDALALYSRLGPERLADALLARLGVTSGARDDIALIILRL
jgi:hypothetical protein